MPEFLRMEPVVRVERAGALPVVSVRPCPDDVPALKSFESFASAQTYAEALAQERGWRLVSPTASGRNRRR